MSSDLADGAMVTTLQGENITVSEMMGTFMLNNNVGFVAVDIPASNGVVHVIDMVLVPGTDTDTDTVPRTIVDVVVANTELSTLLELVQVANLTDVLSGPGPFTLFAPSNVAWDEFGTDLIELLLGNVGLLADVLKYHVIPGMFLSTDLVPGTSLPSLLPVEDIFIDSFMGGIGLNVNVPIEEVDDMALNGVVHVIDTVLLPGNGVGPGPP